jgi:hypothetical protein
LEASGNFQGVSGEKPWAWIWKVLEAQQCRRRGCGIRNGNDLFLQVPGHSFLVYIFFSESLVFSDWLEGLWLFLELCRTFWKYGPSFLVYK